MVFLRVPESTAADGSLSDESPGCAGFETATSAAAAGGITTMVDMPLNSVPCTITAESLRQKLEASKVCHCALPFLAVTTCAAACRVTHHGTGLHPDEQLH